MSDTTTHTRSKGLRSAGIIPDGNRRWAKQNNLDLDQAYWRAMQVLAGCIAALYDCGVQCVCVFLLSRDNIKRGRDDLDAVLKAETRFLVELLPQLKRDHDARAYHAGSAGLLPQCYVRALEAACEAGNGRDDPFPRLYLCAAYDAYDEILRAFVEPGPSRETLLGRLSVPVELDLVIRTGGDLRSSGFLPLQSKYAEYFFELSYFPDFSPSRVVAIVDDFDRRARRFGG